MITLTFHDGEGEVDYVGDIHYTCPTTLEVMEDFVGMTYQAPVGEDVADCEGTVEDWQWRLDDDGLHFHLLDSHDTPFTEDRASYEARPYVRIGD